MVDRIRYPTVSYLPFYYIFFEIDFRFLLLTIFNLQAIILAIEDILSNLARNEEPSPRMPPKIRWWACCPLREPARKIPNLPHVVAYDSIYESISQTQFLKKFGILQEPEGVWHKDHYSTHEFMQHQIFKLYVFF